MQKQSKSIESLPFEQIYEMAEQKLQEMDYDEAQYYFSIAYKKNPLHELVVLCYSNVLKQNGKRKEAKKILENSIKEYPQGTYKRHFELGEIYSGVDSIKIFEAGIQQAANHIKNPFKSVTPTAEIKRDIAQAYASIAEICMTDLLEEPQAEPKCVQALQKGQQSDPSCMDVQLQKANYALFKDNQAAAASTLEIIYKQILSKSSQQQYDSELILQTAKYLIELDAFSKSAQLLETIHEQQANEGEVLYLLAYCAFKNGNYEDCEQYVEQYQEGQNAIADEEIESAMKQLIEELAKVLPKVQTQKPLSKKQKKGESNDEMIEDNTGEGADPEDEWMDVEDDEDNEDSGEMHN